MRLRSILILLSLLTGVDRAFAQGPVAYYPFNGNANDESGNNLHGMVAGPTLTSDRFGRCNSAYSFNAAFGDFIVVEHSPILSFGTRDFTVVAWVKFCTPQVDYAGIVCKGAPNMFYPGYQLQLGDTDKILAQIGTEGVGGQERRGRRPLSDGQWHMLSVTVSSVRDTFTMYVDGVPATQWREVYPHFGSYNVSRADPTPLFIGKERNSIRYFTGLIDDVRLYDRVLDQAELLELYHENGWDGTVRPALTITPPGPITLCEGDSVVLTASCIPNLEWSTSERTQSIVVKKAGVYTVGGNDMSSCGFAASTPVVVNVIPCGRHKWEAGVNCVGQSEVISVHFNTRQGGSERVVSVEFEGPGAEYIEYAGSLPFNIRPTTTMTLPVHFRWWREGTIAVIMRLVTESGKKYEIDLTGTGTRAMTPIFDVNEIRIGSRGVPFDTCITLTSTAPRAIIITDTTWLRTARGFRLMSPQLPVTIRPGSSTRFCFRFDPGSGSSEERLLLGGLEAVNFCPHCYMHELELNTLPPAVPGGSMTSSAGDMESGEEGEGLLDLYPNPSRDNATAELQLVRSENVELMLFDMNGNMVRSLFTGRLERGTHRIPLDLHGISSGVYTLRFVWSGRSGHRMLVVEK